MNPTITGEPEGLLLVDYYKELVAMLAPIEDGCMYPGIWPGKAVSRVSHPSDPDGTGYAGINYYDLQSFKIQKIAATKGNKHQFELAENYTYWIGDGGIHYGPMELYSFNDSGHEVRLNHYQLDLGVTTYDAHGNLAAYASDGGSIYVINRETNEEYSVSAPSSFGYLRMWGRKIFWSDLRGSTSPGVCGYSIHQFDLDSKAEKVLIDSGGKMDKWLEDVWGDWLLYSDYSEGNGTVPGQEKCRSAGADADLMLRYLPTGEEWNITQATGRQWEAAIWDHLVVWNDSQWKDGYPVQTRDLHGVDLCQHTELKERFDGCKTRKGKK